MDATVRRVLGGLQPAKPRGSSLEGPFSNDLEMLFSEMTHELKRPVKKSQVRAPPPSPVVSSETSAELDAMFALVARELKNAK